MQPTVDFSLSHLFDTTTNNFNHFLPRIPNAAVTLVIGFLVIRVLSWIAEWLIGFVRMPKGLKEIIISIIDALLSVFLVIVVLQALGLGNVALVFSAAVAAIGLAIGNGSVVLVQDVLGGIYLARDKDFNVGDIVRVGENQIEGEILSMDMRRTRVRDDKGLIHSIPNSVIERKEYILVTRKRDRQAEK